MICTSRLARLSPAVPKRNEGIASIWVILAFMMLLIFVALAIDTAYVLTVGNQLQNAADAGALAGAQFLRSNFDRVRSAAQSAAAANSAAGQSVQLALNTSNSSDGDIVVGFFDEATETFTPSLAGVNACQVRARRMADTNEGAVPRPFGDLFGPQAVSMQRTSIAMIGGTFDAGLIVLNEDERAAMEISGSAIIRIAGGAAQVNSGHADASVLFGNGMLEAEVLNCAGGVSQKGSAYVSGEIYEFSNRVDDPLAALPEPEFDPLNDLSPGVGSGDITLSPGYYSQGFDFGDNSRVTLQEGIYVLDGAGLRLRGNAELHADGAMFFLNGGEVDLAGTGDVMIKAPDPERHSFPGVETYEGMAIFQSRSNPNEASMLGTSAMFLDGTYYFPNNHVYLQGNSQNFGNQFIANTLDVSGNGDLQINYDNRNPLPGFVTYLVR